VVDLQQPERQLELFDLGFARCELDAEVLDLLVTGNDRRVELVDASTAVFEVTCQRDDLCVARFERLLVTDDLLAQEVGPPAAEDEQPAEDDVA